MTSDDYEIHNSKRISSQTLQEFTTHPPSGWHSLTLVKNVFLLDGPRGSLRRLRNQLAEDGCPESQVVLAKQLLDERCDLEVDREENNRLGVYWLIKASEQGNLEATEILKQCLESGQGVNEQNYLDVKSCLNMSQDEKLARRAAREMFNSLAAGQDFITTDQLQRRLLNAEKDHRDSGPSGQKSLEGSGDADAEVETDESAENSGTEWSSRGDYSGEKLTEDHLVSAAATYAHGELPLVHRVLTLSGPQEREVETMNFLHRALLHPIITFKSLYPKLVETVAKRGTPFLKFIFPNDLSHIQTLVILFLYSILGSESVLLFFPMALYYASFSVMVVVTFQMLHRHGEFRDFRNWSGLFLSYSGGNLNPQEAEYQYCSNKLKPYGHFFMALVVNLMVYPIIAPQWTPQSEMTILAFFLTFLTLYSFMDDRRMPDLLALFSFAIHVLAKYPYETDAVVRQGWRFLDIRIPTFASYVVGNGIEFCLNFRAFFYLLIPAIFYKIAARDNWRGVYKTLIPHCVTLSWWQVAIISSQGATWYGLIRSTLALVGLVLFLPLAGLATILLPIAAVGRYLQDSEYLYRVAATTCLASLPLALSWYLNKHNRNSNYVTRMQIFFAIVAAFSLVFPVLNQMEDQEGNSNTYPDTAVLTWEQYQNHCHQPAWEASSVAVTQLHCAHLSGTPVNWQGYVSEVKIKSIANPLNNLLVKFPTAVKDVMTCFYGEKYETECDANSMGEVDFGRCKLLKTLKIKRPKCHLEAWNRYEFEVIVKMKSGIWGKGADILLEADDSFRNFTLALRPGDSVWFIGTLINDGKGHQLLGGATPQVELLEIGCLGCHKTELQIHKRVVVTVTYAGYIYIGVKSVLNFLFNPLVIFK